MTFKPERQKIQILITWKQLSRSRRNFYRRYAPRVTLRGRSNGSLKQIQDGGGRHLFNFGKISITPDWIKISALNFMGTLGRCIRAMRRWPCHQKSKPEVNSRDVIEWRSEAYMRRSQWLQQIFEPNLVQITNTTLSTRRNGQIYINWKSKMVTTDILNFWKMWITLDWIKISAPYYMERCITAMRRWPHDQKSKPEVNSRDVIKWKSEAYARRSQ